MKQKQTCVLCCVLFCFDAFRCVLSCFDAFVFVFCRVSGRAAVSEAARDEGQDHLRYHPVLRREVSTVIFSSNTVLVIL